MENPINYTWLLRGYESDGEELMVEMPLYGIDLEFLQSMFNEPQDNPMYDCYPIGAKQAQVLLQFMHQEADFTEYDFYVEYI